MPAELDRCVKKVKKQGKDESSAYAICSSSTGWKKRKGGKWKKSIKESKKGSVICCTHCGCKYDDTNAPEVKMGYTECPKCKYWCDQRGKACPPEKKSKVTESKKVGFCPKCKCEQDVIKCRDAAYICAKCKNRLKLQVENTTHLPLFDNLVINMLK